MITYGGLMDAVIFLMMAYAFGGLIGESCIDRDTITDYERELFKW